MISKVSQLLALLVLVGWAAAGPLQPAVVQDAEPFDHNPQYSYSYTIQDAVTGDSKGHSETRNGDVVQGQYSVLDADGTRRIVEYTADAVHGFNAVVRREGTPAAAAAAAPLHSNFINNAVLSARAYPAPASVTRTQYSAPRFAYSVQQPSAAASVPVLRFAAAPGHGASQLPGVHTSVSTPYHSYSY